MGVITKIKANLSSKELGLTSQPELSLAKWRWPKTEDNLNNQEDLKYEDDLNFKDVIKYKTTSNMKMTPAPILNWVN